MTEMEITIETSPKSDTEERVLGCTLEADVFSLERFLQRNALGGET